MYADELKVFMPIRAIDDASKLQEDLDRLSVSCSNNSLFLNVRKRDAMHFAFKLNSEDVYGVDEVMDFGVLFDEKLSFNKHTDISISKAYPQLEFVMRVCSECDPMALKSLYFAQVRPILEFASASQYLLYLININYQL